MQSNQYIFFLGINPKLSLAEIESRFGFETIKKCNDIYAILELEEAPNIDLLGGTIKISKTLGQTKLAENWEAQITNLILSLISEQKITRLKLGLSFYSVNKSVQYDIKTLGRLLETIRNQSKKVHSDLNIRTVLPKDNQLSTAQIVHSGLLKRGGLSLDILMLKDELILAQTVQVPNLRKYTLRDKFKPRPDGKNGMLPPKLAQIMLSLSSTKNGSTILDPFCGSGTVLQEALLQNFDVIGSDLNPKIVDDANQNLDWLKLKFRLSANLSCKLYPALDATSNKWGDHFDTIVTEMFLGQALKKAPSNQDLIKIRRNCDAIFSGFLQNLSSQIKPGFKLVVAAPCWSLSHGKILDLESLEKLSALGYNLAKFKSSDTPLVYIRSGQLVGRRILVLIKQ